MCFTQLSCHTCWSPPELAPRPQVSSQSGKSGTENGAKALSSVIGSSKAQLYQ